MRFFRRRRSTDYVEPRRATRTPNIFGGDPRPLPPQRDHIVYEHDDREHYDDRREYYDDRREPFYRRRPGRSSLLFIVIAIVVVAIILFYLGVVKI